MMNKKSLEWLMRRAFVSTILFLLVVIVPADAAIKYVRTDGGTGVQCTGLADAAYDGSGTGEACALNHPNWALPPRGESTTRALTTGDTLVIKSGSYRVGCQNASTCRDANVNLTKSQYCGTPNPQDCHMSNGGTSEYGGKVPDNVTIVGCSTTGCSSSASYPELWGAGRIRHMFNLNGSDGVTIRDLKITDHASCQYSPNAFRCGSADANELSLQDGIRLWNASNIIIRNVHILGVWRYSLVGGCDDCTIDGDTKLNFGFGGWDWTGFPVTNGANVYIGTTENNNPDRMVEIAYHGCTDTGTGTTPIALGCATFGGSDGIGGDSTSGNFFLNYVYVHHNVADGVDLLYHDQGTGTISIQNSVFSYNGGNQLKFSGNSTIYNNIIEAKCDYYGTSPGSAYAASGEVEVCRAVADAVASTFQTNTTVKFYGNSVIYNNGNNAFTISARGISVCTSSNTFDIKNSVFKANGKSAYLGGGTVGWVSKDSNCGSSVVTQTNSNIYNYSSNPSGTGNIYTDPALSSAFGTMTSSNAYPSGAINIADESASGQPSTDINAFARGAAWDAGALEFGSSYGGGSVCGNEVAETGEVCDGLDLNEATCASRGYTSGTLACAVNCLSYNESGCVTTLCGNGNIDSGEDCDGVNLNGQTCLSRGYASGTLACSSCSFNETGCVSAACGDGNIDPGEECDDDNVVNSDGCSALCENELVGLEKFLLYTEVDTGDTLSVRTHRILLNGINHAADAYTRIDKGASFFGNFVHRMKVRIDSCADNGAGEDGGAGLWSLTSAVRTSLFDQEANSDGLSFSLSCLSSFAQHTWKLRSAENGNSDTYSDIAPTLERYIEFQRTGTTVTAKIYSDSNYSVLLDTLTITGTSTAFRYLNTPQSYNSGVSGVLFSGSVENLNLSTGAQQSLSNYGVSANTTLSGVSF